MFAGDDLGLGVDAGPQGIDARCGVALRGARADGSLGIPTVGVDVGRFRSRVSAVEPNPVLV